MIINAKEKIKQGKELGNVDECEISDRLAKKDDI